MAARSSGLPKLSNRASSRSILRDQPAQHGAGPYLNIRCDALRRKAPHDRFPAYRRRHLRARAPRSAARGVALRLGVHVGDDRARAAVLVASARSSGASRSSAGFISAQWNGALTVSGITRFAHRAPSRSLRRAPRPPLGPAMTTWPGAVQVRRADDLPPRLAAAACATSSRVEAENRGHRAGADRHRLLHVAAAALHRPHARRQTRTSPRRRWPYTRRGCARRQRPAARPLRLEHRGRSRC